MYKIILFSDDVLSVPYSSFVCVRLKAKVGDVFVRSIKRWIPALKTFKRDRVLLKITNIDVKNKIAYAVVPNTIAEVMGENEQAR